LILAIVATTVATLVVAGLGTLILDGPGAALTPKEVRRQASELVAGVASLADRPGGTGRWWP
jgi:hypothetical protein